MTRMACHYATITLFTRTIDTVEMLRIGSVGRQTAAVNAPASFNA